LKNWETKFVEPELERLRLRNEELERMLAESEQLRQESEDRFYRLFHASSNPIAIAAIKDGRLIDLNEASAKLGGYSREDLIGSIEAELELWANSMQRDAIVQMMQKDGRVHNAEVALRTKTGEIRKVLFSADPIVVKDEPCLLCVSFDITAQEKEADALKRTEEKYRLLVENSLQGLSIIQDGRFVFCNNSLATMTGYSVEELLSFPDSKALVHPEDQAFVSARRQERLSGTPFSGRHEHRIIRKDGVERWVEVLASPIEYSGRPAIQVVNMDITERRKADLALRESEEYLNQIINRIGDAIFVKDSQHKFILVNDAMCALAGKCREQLLGLSVLGVLPDDLVAQLYNQEEDVLKTGNECVTEENLPDSQGDFRAMLSRKTLLMDKGGNRQVIGVLRDISEYKRLQQQFMQSQKMKAVGLLAGGVAHDFNNLLTVIKGYTEMLVKSYPPQDPIQLDLDQIYKAANQASTLTTQLLAFSRKQILQPEILDLNASIMHMSAMLRRLIGEDIELVTKTEQDLGPINADPGQIQQILLNLAVNARDAMPDGGKLTIEMANANLDEDYVRAHPLTKAGAYVMLAVSDNGIGMDSDTQARLFEPFFTTKEKGKGTGLGLPTVYGIVKQSDGFIWVYSELGKGSTFKIYFPRVEAESPKAMGTGNNEQSLQGIETVLVVEDEDSVRALTSRILIGKGYSVLQAANGNDALEIVQKHGGDIQLVITDVVMPGMGGKALGSKLKAIRPGIKILYVSGYTDNAIVHHGILDSGVDFLPKPYTVESLARKVRAVIDSTP
jgi:PAS domain S-box-containing protein